MKFYVQVEGVPPVPEGSPLCASLSEKLRRELEEAYRAAITPEFEALYDLLKSTLAKVKCECDDDYCGDVITRLSSELEEERRSLQFALYDLEAVLWEDASSQLSLQLSLTSAELDRGKAFATARRTACDKWLVSETLRDKVKQVKLELEAIQQELAELPCADSSQDAGEQACKCCQGGQCAAE